MATTISAINHFSAAEYQEMKELVAINEELKKLEAKKKKHIRQALKKSCVKKLSPLDYKEQMYEVYVEASKNYENFRVISLQAFCKNVENCVKDKIEYWGAFDSNNKMIGWMSVKNYGDWACIISAKFHPHYLNLGPSDAIYYNILTYYLNETGVEYISSGEKNISHATNTQEYKIRTFAFRKAYCKLNIYYRPKYKLIVSLLYPMRRILKNFEKLNIVHKINGVLKMEEIIRKQKKNDKE
jgi:hypothetical protein